MSEGSEKDERIFTVYAAGCPDEGVELPESELLSRLAEGSITTGDLVLVDGIWRQLSDVFEMEPFALPDYSDAQEPEIALSFKELPASAVGQSVGAKAPSAVGVFCRRIFYRRDGRRRSGVLLALSALGVVASLVALVLYGIIPGMNRLLWRPAYILVLNPHRGVAGEVVFDGEVYALPAGGSVTIPDIFGRMPRTEQLQIRYPEDTWTITVPLRGGESVLVNPRGSLWLGVIKEQGLAAVRLSEGERQNILGQMMAGQPPVRAVQLSERAQKIGSSAVKACTADNLIYSSDEIVREGGLNFEQLGLRRSEDDMLAGDGGIPVGAVLPGHTSRNLLSGVRLGDVQVSYRKNQRDVVKCSFDVSFPRDKQKLFQPVARLAVKGKPRPPELRQVDPLQGKATVQVEWRDKRTLVQLQAHHRESLVIRNQRRIYGQWTYRAVREPSGKWDWRWHYRGQDKVRVATLEFEVSRAGVKVLRYEEKRGKK